MKIYPTIILALTLSLASCNESEVADTPAEATKTDAYPLTTCVVSGKELGSMGEPVVVKHEGTTVKLCCKHCIDKFNSDPASYAKKVTDAE